MSDEVRMPLVIPKSLLSMVTVYELGLLLLLQRYHPNTAPSTTELCRDAKMSRSQMFKVMASLERKGLLARRRRSANNGATLTTEYELLIWDKWGATA